jgi:aminotransferase
MTRECERIGGVNLGQGICDQTIEPSIRKAAAAAIEAGLSQYSKLEGIDELRRRIVGKAVSYNGIQSDPDTQVVVTVGSTGAFALACLALIEPGDEAVVFSPFYAYHVNLIRLCGATPVRVRLRAPSWELDPAELRAAFGRKTRLVLVNTPCNPCGKVFTEEELRAIGELAGGHAAVVVTDEIYEYILFDGHRHVSLASLDGMAGHTVTLSGLSKTYSMTGWRLGYAIAPADIAEKLGLLNDLLYICAPTPLQHAAVAAFDLPDSYYAGLRDDYREKRDLMVDACREAGIRPFVPQGTYYFLAEISGLGCADDRAAAQRLLTEAGVAVVPGSAFYPDRAGGRRQARFCFAKEMSDIEEACRRLRRLRR